MGLRERLEALPDTTNGAFDFSKMLQILDVPEYGDGDYSLQARRLGDELTFTWVLD